MIESKEDSLVVDFKLQPHNKQFVLEVFALDEDPETALDLSILQMQIHHPHYQLKDPVNAMYYRETLKRARRAILSGTDITVPEGQIDDFCVYGCSNSICKHSFGRSAFLFEQRMRFLKT